MKITANLITNLRIPEVIKQVEKAVGKGLVDVVTVIASDAIKGSPHDTGHNRRSITYEVGPGKEVAKEKTEGAVYSTSGYGGYLETGTVKMAARPYMKPALDMNLKKLPEFIKGHLG